VACYEDQIRTSNDESSHAPLCKALEQSTHPKLQ
jgi:hypothetical protein